jgi:hypothetical protein
VLLLSVQERQPVIQVEMSTLVRAHVPCSL